MRRSKLRRKPASCPICEKRGRTICVHTGDSTGLKRKTRLTRGKGPRPINPERRARERERAYGSKRRQAWIRQQPSVVSGKTPCVNAHVPDPEGGPSGMGRKADARWVVPLILDEERELHRVGIETFQTKYGVDLIAKARETEAKWQTEAGRDSG